MAMSALTNIILRNLFLLRLELLPLQQEVLERFLLLKNILPIKSDERQYEDLEVL